MGYVPVPNVWRMTDAEFDSWWRSEKRRILVKFAILFLAFSLSLVLVGVVIFIRSVR